MVAVDDICKIIQFDMNPSSYVATLNLTMKYFDMIVSTFVTVLNFK